MTRAAVGIANPGVAGVTPAAVGSSRALVVSGRGHSARDLRGLLPIGCSISTRRSGRPSCVARRGSALLSYRRVLRPLFVRFADLDIAMRIEERWPGLNDRLASTIQFVQLDAGDDAPRFPGACVRRRCARPSRKPARSTFAR